MRTYTAEEIRQTIPKELETLRRDFPDAPWAHELAPMMEELFEIAGTAPNIDPNRLTALQRRLSQFIEGDKKLKGLAPLLWMADSLQKAVTVSTRHLTRRCSQPLAGVIRRFTL